MRLVALCPLLLSLTCSQPIQKAATATLAVEAQAPPDQAPTSPPPSSAAAYPSIAARTTPDPATPALRPEPALVQEPGSADLNPENDFEVGPPTVIPDCRERLERAGVRFLERPLPLKQKLGNTHTCGTEQAVAYLSGPGKIRYRPTPLLSCGMAIAMAKFEVLLQEHAQRSLGQRVTRIEQLGTYSCRKMARYPEWVSEHSYANAIDISALSLENGRRISVLRDFGALDQGDVSRQADFLRGLSRSLYADNVFSVVLTPYFDRLHKDHFHLDLARYRMDGTGR